MNKVRHKTQRLLRGAARRAFRTVMLVCVFASLWQAPLPVIHRHVQSVNLEIAQCLDQHLRAWHSGGVKRGWHLHFAMLDDILRGGGCPIPSDHEDQPPATEHIVLVDQIVGSGSVLLAKTESAFGQHAVWIETPVCFPPSVSRRQFLGDHSESHRLQTVLCVALC